jgi:hypothetical protein
MLLLKKYITLPFFLGAIIFVYLLARIILMPVSDDEYMTIHYHSCMPWWDVLTCGQPNKIWSGNNHILNTIFVKLEIGIFGRKDWAIRLHIVVAFLFSFYYALQLLQLYVPSAFRQVLYLTILFCNPYLLDFFAIARGYALSIAGFYIAIYYLILFVQHKQAKHLFLVMLGNFIAIFSNFSALYIYFLMALIIVYNLYQNASASDFKKCLLVFIGGSVFIFIVNIIPFLVVLFNSDIYGGHTGLYQDCVVNYISQFIHHNPYINRHFINANGWKLIEVLGVEIGLGALLLVGGSYIIKATKALNQFQNICLLLLIGTAVIVKFLAVTKGVPLPSGRTQLLFSIPFYLLICIAIERIITQKPYFIIVPVLFFLTLGWHFYNSLTFYNTIEWWRNGDGKEMAAYFKTLIDNKTITKQVQIGVDGWQNPSFSFYSEVTHNNLTNNNWTDFTGVYNYDYLIVPNFENIKINNDYLLIKQFKKCNIYKHK